jgi:membrane protease YdiL (CAAX protease family)
VLISMGVTAIVLLGISKLWMYVGNVALFPIDWQPDLLPLAFGLSIVIAALSGLLYWVWPAYRLSTVFYLDLVVRPLRWPDLFWLGILPGMSEELLFRGTLLPSLGGDWLALGLTSVAFGAMHLSGRKYWPYAFWAGCVGAMLGYSAIATGNLLVPIVAHISTNIISGSIWKWHFSRTH